MDGMGPVVVEGPQSRTSKPLPAMWLSGSRGTLGLLAVAAAVFTGIGAAHCNETTPTSVFIRLHPVGAVPDR